LPKPKIALKASILSCFIATFQGFSLHARHTFFKVFLAQYGGFFRTTLKCPLQTLFGQKKYARSEEWDPCLARTR
jgi:hypothetical protein